MRGILQKSESGRQRSTSDGTSVHIGTRTSLGPQYSVPPFPHPLPEMCISLHCTSQGLVILSQKQERHATHHGKHDTKLHSTEDGYVEDVANERQISTSIQEKSQGSGSPHFAAYIPWSRDGLPQSMTPSDAKALSSQHEVPFILAYGIVGILRLFNDAYLLVVTSRTQVGDYLQNSQPVYKCSGVLSIPLKLHKASDTIKKEMVRQQNWKPENPDTDTDDNDSSQDSEDDVSTPALSSKDSVTRDPFSSSMGAALKNAKSRTSGNSPTSTGVSPGQKVDSTQPDCAKTEAPSTSQISTLTADERWHEAAKAEVEDKVVIETAKQYCRGEMYFTYDFDLTTPVQRKQENLETSEDQKKSKSHHKRSPSKTTSNHNLFAEPWATLPLWRRADRRFWHNEHLLQDFCRAGLHSLIIPIMQGFFQVTNLPLPENSPAGSIMDVAGNAMEAVTKATTEPRTEAQLLIISRRSKERAGLRYQRRGINDQGQVANFVESEQILRVYRDGEYHIFSFVQIRGSIPLYWRQDPFSMKPPPVLERGVDENRDAFEKHFRNQLPRYGSVTCVNLAEQHGKEGAITKAYHDAVEQMNNPAVTYKAFDFHEECKGMRFERIALLIDDLKDAELQNMGYFWKSSDVQGNEVVHRKQNGVFRVSCLDCLDRTNVVQSAFARFVLERQMQKIGFQVPSEKFEGNDSFDFAFNDSWANNGDMISQIYAGTKALKGDFTRTGKRNLIGMMNDATNSVYRMVRGAVSDFFKQTVIDFQYGYASLATLERYNDSLAVADPSESMRLARVRAHAIESCTREAIRTDENLLAAWTLLSPIDVNRIESPRMEEKVVLLTTKAFYSCGYDFTAEKLVEVSRIKYGDILGIRRGLYILSPHEGYNPDNYWGLVISYIHEERRLNTSSMRNLSKTDAVSAPSQFIAFRAVVDNVSSAKPSLEEGSRFVKMDDKKDKLSQKQRLRRPQSFHSPDVALSLDTFSQASTSHEIIDKIVEDLFEQCITAGACADEDRSSFIQETTIQSLAQAKANASLFAPLIEGLKRRVWL